MKIIKKFILLMQYSIYKSYCIFFKANPLLFTYELPFAKRLFAKRGYDNPTKDYMNVMTDPNYGFATIFAGGLVAASLGFLLSGISYFLCGILQINIKPEYQMIIIFSFSYLFFYFFVWNKVKEVKKEFKKFDKMRKWKKYLWTLITLLFFVVAIVIWFKGIFFLGKSLENFN
jgi:ABC-type branched-subunit amino acid transport system permease subunit